MLVPTSKHLIVGNQNNKREEAFNTMKIDFSKMSFIRSNNDNYTQCQKCKGVLTIEDKQLINIKQTDENGNFKWNCRFCKSLNLTKQIYFVSSNFKRVLLKNLSTKITPPIILFLIDISGSMQQSIYKHYKNFQQVKKMHMTQQTRKIISQSIMRKNQLLELEQLRSRFGTNNQKQKNVNQTQMNISKISLLYAIIQNSLKSLKAKKNKTQYRVGFIFFSDAIYVTKGAKQKTIPMYIHQHQKIDEEYPFKKQSIDFYDFNKFVEKGKAYDRFFGDSRLDNFDITKIPVGYIKTGGKTALGPALSLAMGIIQQHDQGSKILLVTDSRPNFGVLSDQKAGLHYKQIGQKLKKSKAMLNVLKWSDKSQFKMNEEQMEQFQQFQKNNKEYVQKIELSFNFSKAEDPVETSIRSINNFINKEALGHPVNISLITDNTKISFDKFKFDNLDYKNLRFINTASKNWIQTTLNKNSLTESDFLFPVMTQLIIEYDDVFTKQRCLFMSYTIQRLIKNPHTNSVKSFEILQEYLQEININNLQDITDLQSMQRYIKQKDQNPFQKRTYRNQLKKQVVRYNHLQIDSMICQTPNEYAFLQNKIQQNLEEDYEYQTL